MFLSQFSLHSVVVCGVHFYSSLAFPYAQSETCLHAYSVDLFQGFHQDEEGPERGQKRPTGSILNPEPKAKERNAGVGMLPLVDIH